MGLVGDENYIDIDLSVTQKKKFRIDGDDDRILELDTSDLSILTRFRDAQPKLNELVSEIVDIKIKEYEDTPDGNVEAINEMGTILESIDKKMRELMDYIFDADVSRTCAPSGTMYDMFNGQYRYEHIMNTLFKLYEDNINKEYKKLATRVRKHTDKYTKR